jgi:AraC-like DNA-binding protein
MNFLQAQVNIGGTPVSFNYEESKFLESLAFEQMPPLDMVAIEAEDEQWEAERAAGMMKIGRRFGIEFEVDLLIMKEIEKLMLEDKLYRDTTLSVDLLAHKLKAKRYYISMTINRCMSKSFNTFINEYRIKEAIQLLSKNENNTFKIDSIAFDVGFNDRKSFHRVFKKMTGLSPTEFKRNIAG